MSIEIQSIENTTANDMTHKIPEPLEVYDW